MRHPDTLRLIWPAVSLILMMVLFHTLFDLNYFQIFIIQVYDGFWRYFAFATASLFLLIVGISLTISRSRAVSKIPGNRLTLKFVSRGAGIFLLGLLVTAGNLALYPGRFHRIWDPAPDWYFHNDLPPLLPV